VTVPKNREERIAQRHFAHVVRYKQGRRGFSAFPWVLRRVLWLFAPRTWEVLSYLMLRMGRESIVWVTDETMAKDIGVTPRKISPHIRRLAELGFIAAKVVEGQRYVAIVDPLFTIQQLVNRGVISGERLEDLNDDMATMKLSPFEVGSSVHTEGSAA
jgi:hypothetical protein